VETVTRIPSSTGGSPTGQRADLFLGGDRIGRWPSPLTQCASQKNGKPIDGSFPCFIVKDSFTVTKHSQDANKSQNVTRDDVLKRMLKMKPQPHKFKKFEADKQIDLADSEDSASDISDRNVSSGKATDRNDD
jgi:hypothetical protein